MVAVRAEFLKLARPLVMAAGVEMAAFAEAKSVVTFAQYTGSTVIAEGVENEAASSTCESLMVDQAQGWLFGRPQAAADLQTS